MATLRSPELGPPAIQATIDETPYTITEDLVRSQVQLADDGGIDDLPIAKIYSGMDNLGYVTEGKLTFSKNKFSPQWRFLVHTILHCLSTKSGGWDPFGSPLAVALIYLSDGRRFNWSSYIFKGMVSNIGNAKKFLMYLRFLQTILGIKTSIKRQYQVLKFSSKVFANMRLNFEGHPMQLLAAMLSQDQEGEGAGVAAQAVPQHMPAPDQPQDHLSTPSRPQTSDPNAPVFEHDQSSDLNSASFSRTHETDDDPFTNVEDEPLGGSFHMSPPRSTQAPPAETELKDHKKLFKDVVGKLVKKVKAMEVGGKTQDHEKEDGSMTVDSNIPHGDASNNPAASTRKSPMVDEDITVKERTFKQIEDDRLGEQAAKRLQDEKQAQLNRQRAELQRRRQQKVLASAMYYTEADWLNTMAQAALIKRKKQALAEKLAKERMDRPMNQGQQRTYMRHFVKNQSSAIYSTGWSMARVKSFTDDQLKPEFKKIQKALSNIQIQAFSQTLNRTVFSSPKSSGTMRKSLGRKRLTKPKSKLNELDLDVNDQTFIKVVSNEDSEDEAPFLWSALVGWEVITTPLGDINAFYRIVRSTAHFTTLRQILHMVDRQDLVTLYGLMVKYYENHPIAGVGLIFRSGGRPPESKGELLRLSPRDTIRYLNRLKESESSKFPVDVSYPFSVKLMERMLKHKLEIDKDVVGNDMTTAEQLIQFIKNQLAAAQVSPA
nr:hypothetical protein [Tanacetum cinerariifolium]